MWNSKLALGFCEIVHKGHHDASGGWVEWYILGRQKTRNHITHFETSSFVSSDNMANIAIRYIWSDMLWAQQYHHKLRKDAFLDRTSLSGFGICKPMQISPKHGHRCIHFFYLVINPSSPLLSLDLYHEIVGGVHKGNNPDLESF